MDLAVLHRGGRRHQRLAEHLSAEYLRTADVTALSAKQIDFQALERHHLDQIFEQLIHDFPSAHSAPATPNRFCMMGLVVVYCKNCRFSGNR